MKWRHFAYYRESIKVFCCNWKSSWRYMSLDSVVFCFRFYFWFISLPWTWCDAFIPFDVNVSINALNSVSTWFIWPNPVLCETTNEPMGLFRVQPAHTFIFSPWNSTTGHWRCWPQNEKTAKEWEMRPEIKLHFSGWVRWIRLRVARVPANWNRSVSATGENRNCSVIAHWTEAIISKRINFLIISYWT